MISRLARFILITALLTLAAYACTLAGANPASLSNIEVTQTLEAAASLMAVMQHTPQTEFVNTPKVITPAPSPTPKDTATLTPIRFYQPWEPGAHTSAMSDRSSAPLAEQHRTIGDHFDFNIYERPFTAEDMTYKAYIDIAPGTELSLDAVWVYVTIFLVEASPADAEVTYAVEVDLNLDGRGDWLITAALPPSTKWTTEGVRAYLDSNGDVGGRIPVRADAQPGNGYDTLLFERGRGFDPDTAWVRRSPHNHAVIQIAFKHTLIGKDVTFIWSAWANGGEIHPEWFDYNDHFTATEAGSPVSSSRYYPLQALALVDNTCRWGQGIVPRMDIPGFCGSNISGQP